MEFVGTGSPRGQCQLLVLRFSDRPGFDVVPFVTLAQKIGLPVTHYDEAPVTIGSLHFLSDKLRRICTGKDRRKLMVCGGCLEEQVSVVAQYLLVTGFDVVLIRDLVRVIRPVHASIHDHRLVQAGVVMTTLEQLVYEWMVNETEADTQVILARFYKGVR